MPSPASGTRVEAIPGTPLPHGLADAATVLPIDSVHELLGVSWQPMSCGEAHTTTWCPDPDDPLGGDSFDPEKVTDDNRPASSEARPVTVYAAIDCAAVGMSQSEAEERARALLDIGEARALEDYVWRHVIAPTATDLSATAGETTITPRLGVLEEALAAVYGGTGVLHVPVRLGPYMASANQLQLAGTRLRTWSGHNVAIGAGYPGTGPAGEDGADTTRWLFITGPVTIRRELSFLVPDSESASVNIVTNDRVVIAERTSVVGVDCDAFAIDVSLAQCCA